MNQEQQLASLLSNEIDCLQQLLGILKQEYEALLNADIEALEQQAKAYMYLEDYEQALIMFNSISILGMKWEFTPEKPKNPNIKTDLITTYNLTSFVQIRR